MKWITTAVVAFVAGVVLTALVCRAIQRADEVAYKSGVAAPTAQIVSEINADIRNGETNRAFARLSLLEKRLVEYIHGGPTPEVFISEIRKIEGPEANTASHGTALPRRP